MLKLMRQVLKKEKGVTLVELLAVIIILGIIALIAVPAIAGVIEDSKVDSIKSSAINYINAAELYAVTHDLNDNDTVSLSELRSEGYVKDELNTDVWGENGYVTIIDGQGYITATATDDVTIIFDNAKVSDINDYTYTESDNRID